MKKAAEFGVQLRRGFFRLLLAVALLLGATAVSACGGQAGGSDGSGGGAAQKTAEQVAIEQWDAAYAAAEQAWQALQDQIGAAEGKVAEFATKKAKNPDTLTTLAATLAEAKQVQDAHGSISMPNEAADIEASTTELNSATEQYSQATTRLSEATSAVEEVDPNKGSFDWTDADGYSYHVEYEMNARFTTDSSEGKPGQTALYMDLTGCKVSVRNTTPGKKAPGIKLLVFPLYSLSRFSDVVDVTDFAKFGPLHTPSTWTEILAVKSGMLKLTDWNSQYDEIYINPFDNDPDNSNRFAALGKPYNISGIVAGVESSNSAGTTITSGKEFAVGETRQLDVGFENSMADKKKVKVGEINDGVLSLLSNGADGWAICPNGKIPVDQTYYFMGATDKSSDLGDNRRVFTYLPPTR